MQMLTSKGSITSRRPQSALQRVRMVIPAAKTSQADCKHLSKPMSPFEAVLFMHKTVSCPSKCFANCTASFATALCSQFHLNNCQQ